MKFLKYTPLFLIYYIFNLREIRKIPISIAVNVFYIGFLYFLSGSDFNVNKEVSVKNMKHISDIEAPIDNNFISSYNKLNFSFTNSEDKSKFLQPKSAVKNITLTPEKSIFYKKKDFKNFTEKLSNFYEVPEWTVLYIISKLDEITENNIPSKLEKSNDWGKEVEKNNLLFEDLEFSESFVTNTDYGMDLNMDGEISKTNLAESTSVLIDYLSSDLKVNNSQKDQEILYKIVETLSEDNVEKLKDEVEDYFSGVNKYPKNKFIEEYVKSKESYEELSEYLKGFSFEDEEDLNYGELKYYWKKFENKLKYKREKKSVIGSIGEVGTKNGFPIFIQGDPAENISKIPWRFNGRSTTLGNAGCSLYSLCSIIHKAGYGDYEIPNTNLKPTMKNLSNVFRNGPVIGRYVERQGYLLRYRSTATKEGLDGIFNDLLLGIPYVINTKYGTITAYKKDGSTENTVFTNGGHFLILDRGIKRNGRRFVSVIQSSRSHAGTWGLDQNNVLFDYDELIRKKILRSSDGTPVPAYTIVGGKNLPKPKYLSKLNIKTVNEDENREEMVKKDGWFDKFIKDFGVDEDKLYSSGCKVKGDKDIRLDTKSLVFYKDKSIIIFIDSVNALMIDDLIEIGGIIGEVDKNMFIGKTSDHSYAYYVTKGEDDIWYKVMSDNLENNLDEETVKDEQ